jgi:hypothetical protein
MPEAALFKQDWPATLLSIQVTNIGLKGKFCCESYCTISFDGHGTTHRQTAAVVLQPPAFDPDTAAKTVKLQT